LDWCSGRLFPWTPLGDLAGKCLVRPALEKKLPRLLTRDYKHPNFSARHLLKDVELFLKEAFSYELTASCLEGIRQVLERNIAQRLGYSDYSAIFEMVNPIP
jgi:3-hydroxyisobutyrate dehydrogenase